MTTHAAVSKGLFKGAIIKVEREGDIVSIEFMFETEKGARQLYDGIENSLRTYNACSLTFKSGHIVSLQ